MTIPIPLRDGALHIDNSSMERFTTCPRSAYYNYFLKRQRSGTRSALQFGKIIHKALEYRYKHLDLPLQQVQAKQLEILSAEFSDYVPPEDDYRTYGFACEVIFAYNEHYPIEVIQMAVNPNDGKVMVEVPFAVPLGFVTVKGPHISYTDNGVPYSLNAPTGENVIRIPVIWTGKFDLAYRADSRLYLMDHKTTSMLGEGFYRDFELSHATHGYAYALESILKEPVYGYVINALATRKPTKTGKGIEFERKSVVLARELLDEWQEDTLSIVQTMCQNAADGYLPKHTKWCVGKYGTCEYHMLCNTPPNSRPIMLQSAEFQDVTWSPHTTD